MTAPIIYVMDKTPIEVVIHKTVNFEWLQSIGSSKFLVLSPILTPLLWGVDPRILKVDIWVSVLYVLKPTLLFRGEVEISKYFQNQSIA